MISHSQDIDSIFAVLVQVRYEESKSTFREFTDHCVRKVRGDHVPNLPLHLSLVFECNLNYQIICKSSNFVVTTLVLQLHF